MVFKRAFFSSFPLDESYELVFIQTQTTNLHYTPKQAGYCSLLLFNSTLALLGVLIGRLAGRSSSVCHNFVI